MYEYLEKRGGIIVNMTYKIHDNFRNENKVTRMKIMKQKIVNILELAIKRWYNAN